jgi:integrase
VGRSRITEGDEQSSLALDGPAWRSYPRSTFGEQTQVAREYLDRSPFRRGSETLIRLFREDNKRRRRISDDEEQRLLDAAPPILRAMIITALDTGMRRGEMLALRSGDIDWSDQTITLRGPTTKSGKTTKIPIATLRLRAVLEWLRLDAAGQRKPDSARVFSNGVGEPIRGFRTAWVSTLLKAHGTRPQWSKGGVWKSLTPECQERFRAINLHWHDIRHEFASRLDERGVPLSQIRDLLGHASIVTTERYDHHTFAALQQAAGRLESGKAFTSASQTKDEASAGDAVSETEKTAEGAERKELKDLAGRQGFEPRYRGPESGEWVAVSVGPFCFVPVFGVSASVGSPPFCCVHAQNVSSCLRLTCLPLDQAPLPARSSRLVAGPAMP